MGAIAALVIVALSSAPTRSLTHIGGQEWHVVVPLGGARADSVSARIEALGIGAEAMLYTAWDGGPRRDLRMMRLLRSRGLRGTFFLLPDSPVVPDAAELVAGGMEIGAHGVTGRRFSLLSPEQIDYELRASRAALEVASGRAVRSFVYPEHDSGMHSWMHAEIVERLLHAGYLAVRNPSSEPIGAAPAAGSEPSVNGIHFRDELSLVNAVDAMEGEGVGYGTGLWGSAWELAAWDRGAEEYQWGDLAGLLRLWSAKPRIDYVTLGEAALGWKLASSARLTRTVTEDRGNYAVSVLLPQLDLGDLPYASAPPLSVVFCGVSADEAWVNGKSAPTERTAVGTRVLLSERTALPEPTPYCAAPDDWQLALRPDTAGIPRCLVASVSNDAGERARLTVAPDVPFGWTCHPVERVLELDPGRRADAVFDLYPPTRPAADRTMFGVRARFVAGTRTSVRLLTIECSVPRAPEEAGHSIRDGLVATCMQPASETSPGQPARIPSLPPASGYRPYEASAEGYRGCYVDMRRYAGEPGVYGPVWLRTTVNVPTDRPLRLDIVTTANMSVWWNGELVTSLSALSRPQSRVQALVPVMEWPEVRAGSHELAVRFEAGVRDPRDESGFLAFLTDAAGKPYTDITFGS